MALVLVDPDIYTEPERTRILKERTCPECGAPLELVNNVDRLQLKCQDELECGFFCSVRSG